MTLLKFINVFFLQWFFVRLTRCTEERCIEFDIYEISILPGGSYAPGGIVKYKTYQWFSLQLFIVPLTGWWSNFKYVGGKPVFIDITEEKEVID